MLRLLEFFTNFYWIVLPQTFAETLLNADWAGAFHKSGPRGVLSEFIRSLLGINSVAFFVPIDCQWSGADIEALLKQHGIKMWGVGYANGELFFHVRQNQAAWAQYVMLRAGVPLLHGLLTEPPARTGAVAPRHLPRVVTMDTGRSVEGQRQPRNILSTIDKVVSGIDTLSDRLA